jgi:hypothetical protein
MKPLLGLILSVFAYGAWAQSVELHVMLNGSQQAVNDAEVVTALTAMVESATVDTTKYVRPAEQWDEALAAPIFVHALFPRPRSMKVWKEGDTTAASPSGVHEIVIVFPGAPQILVKTEDGVRSVAKYSPCALEKVITVARLDTVTNAQSLRYLREHCNRS